MPNGQTDNPLDRLWRDPDDRQAENELRQLWLQLQADRKDAWERLQAWVATSQCLQKAAQKDILKAGGRPDALLPVALREACRYLRKRRWVLPAGEKNVCLPSLRARTRGGRLIWVDRALDSARTAIEVTPMEPIEELLNRPFRKKDRARANKEANDE